MKFINKLEVSNFRKGFDIKWNDLKDINILIGQSGSGKSWLFDKMLGQFHSMFQDRNEDLKCEYTGEFNKYLDRVNSLHFTNNLMSYYCNIPKISLKDAKYLSDFLNDEVIKSNFGDKVSYNVNIDKSYSLTINNDNYRVSVLSDAYNKILYIFSSVYQHRNNENTVVLIDSFFDTLDIYTQEIIVDALYKVNPNAQYFIITNSPFIFKENETLKESVIGMNGLLVKNENEQKETEK